MLELRVGVEQRERKGGTEREWEDRREGQKSDERQCLEKLVRARVRPGGL